MNEPFLDIRARFPRAGMQPIRMAPPGLSTVPFNPPPVQPPPAQPQSSMMIPLAVGGGLVLLALFLKLKR